MKRKMILPLLAVVFALASAFATAPLTQMAFYHVAPNTHASGAITTPPDKPCDVGRAVQCFIGTEVAYEDELSADTQNNAGLLKYNP